MLTLRMTVANVGPGVARAVVLEQRLPAVFERRRHQRRDVGRIERLTVRWPSGALQPR